MNSINDMYGNNVVDLLPRLRQKGSDSVERATICFIDLYKTIGVEQAMNWLNASIPEQFREQVLELADERIELEDLIDYSS